jgi:predicted transcriptional regulator
MENKILNFFLLRKEQGNTYSSLITLDRYLVNVEKDMSCLGSSLSEKIQDMINQNLLLENNEKKYSITPKGLEYLKQHLDE